MGLCFCMGLRSLVFVFGVFVFVTTIKWVDGWMDGWVDHSCMYFTPIRFGILSRTNEIAACIYGSFL